jgi:hypothetical protein
VSSPVHATAAKHFFQDMGGKGSGGHNRKTVARKKREGNAGKRSLKKKRRPRAPQSSGPLGVAPSHLRAAQKTVWDELSSIVPIGAVQASDRWAFELLVCLMSKFRRGDAKAGEVNQISSLLARFGMTPADHGRVSERLPQQQKTDPFAKFNMPVQPRSMQ